MQKTKIAIYIGKFQPLHNAHKAIINHCLDNYDETIVLVGSVNRLSSIKYPFSYATRRAWIKEISDSLIIKPLKDYIYNETKWISQVEEAVYTEFSGPEYEFTLVGHSKDETSYYLREFPNFRSEEIEEKFNNLSATSIRSKFFQENMDFQDLVPENVFEELDDLKSGQWFQRLVEESQFYLKEKELFASYPYPQTLKFNCSDSVVVCDANVLLIKRKLAPGKDAWALPGGFVLQDETYEECALRELYEETNIKVPLKVMKFSIKSSKIFDSPNRTIGIPRITNAFYYTVLPDMKNGFPKLPKVKGADDASEAQWFSLAEVKHMSLFDDHSDIIDYFTNSI